MGKINKFANIYDTEGNLIRHTADDGKLKNYTIEELEQLVDKLAEDKDENGNIKDPQALNNVYGVLSNEYKKNPNYLIKKFSELSKSKKTDTEEVVKALEEVNEELKAPKELEMDKYVDYEMVA